MNSTLDTFSSVVSLAALSQAELEALSAVPVDVADSFVRATYRDLKNNPLAIGFIQELCARSTASEFSLAEWLRQLVRMYSWLHAHESTAKFGDVLEYVGCAFEGSSLQPGHNLDWYLTNYGFERRTPLSSAT